MSPHVKTTSEPEKSEIDHLDDAVNELSKQTEALLGKAGEKVSVKTTLEQKPELPKKSAPLKKRGFHFDIISNPVKKTLHPTFSPTAAMPTQKLLEADYDDDEDESTINNVNAEPAANPVEVSEPAPAHETSLISGHSTGSLRLEEPTNVEEKDTDQKTVSTKAKVDAPTFTLPVKEPEFNKPPTPLAKNNDENEKDDSLKSEQATNNTLESLDPAENIKIDKEGTIKTDEPPAEDSREVYANNLVKETSPKGYQEHPGQQKPTVFDTNEYHPPLHDWSTLDHGNRLTWLIVGGALIAAAALFYLFILR